MMYELQHHRLFTKISRRAKCTWCTCLVGSTSPETTAHATPPLCDIRANGASRLSGVWTTISSQTSTSPFTNPSSCLSGQGIRTRSVGVVARTSVPTRWTAPRRRRGVWMEQGCVVGIQQGVRTSLCPFQVVYLAHVPAAFRLPQRLQTRGHQAGVDVPGWRVPR